MDSSEMADLRHDLKNVLLALKSGCLLIDARVAEAEAEGEAVREILEEMRGEIARGVELADRLQTPGS